MNNLLIVLAVLFITLLVMVPLLEKVAKPVSNENMQKYRKITGVLMMLLVLAVTIRFFMKS